MGNMPNCRMMFSCNNDLATPGNCASFSTYADMLDWANRAFELGLSKSDRKRACCEVLPRGCAMEDIQKVKNTDVWSSAYQYYVFSLGDSQSSPVVVQYVALGELVL